MTMTVARLLADNPRIASLPHLHARLMEAIDDPGVSYARIGRIIAEDTGLTVRLLRIANSALYGFPSPIETVEGALARIGTRQLRELALATTVMRMFGGLENTLVSMESFWHHSLCCAAAARVLATARRETNIERYFTLGILHDVGRLIMYRQLGPECGAALARAARERLLLVEVEREIIGFDHAEVGAALLRQWELPPSQSEAVGCHHQPLSAMQHPLEAAVLHVADWLANALRLGTSGEQRVPPLVAGAWQCLGLPESGLALILERTDAQYAAALQLFMDTGPL